MMKSSHVAYAVGDFAALSGIGALIALVVSAVVGDGTPMYAAMLVGVGLGFVVQLVAGLAVAPIVGIFEVMMPGMGLGMFGGMVFGALDSQFSIPLGAFALLGALAGLAVMGGFRTYNRALTGGKEKRSLQPGSEGKGVDQ